MPAFIDLTGKTFGRLIVKERAENYERFSKTHNRILKYARWKCECRCGNTVIVLASDLKSGSQISCGCYFAEINPTMVTRHRLSKSSEYKTWQGILDRCFNKKNKGYDLYGGRGITVCERWSYREDGEGLQNFINDMSPRPDGLTLERKDNSKGYSPENCVWTTSRKQSLNTRNNKELPYSYNDKGRWVGRFTLNGEDVIVGRFSTEVEAHKAAMDKMKELGIDVSLE